jgi:hypothetical protein
VRRAHHHAFENGLPADKGLFATFQRGKKLHGHEKAHEISKRTHSD